MKVSPVRLFVACLLSSYVLNGQAETAINSVSGIMFSDGPCIKEGCYAELATGPDELNPHDIFIPKAIDPERKIFDEGIFVVNVKYGKVEGKDHLIVTKVISKRDLEN
jgi:hypothetical protein